MDTHPPSAPDPCFPEGEPVAGLLAALEARSRERPDRVLRLRGTLPADPGEDRPTPEPFELLIFRGFSSSTTHPTAFDPDRPPLPPGARIEAAELLQGPLDPAAATVLAGPGPVEDFLDPGRW